MSEPQFKNEYVCPECFSDDGWKTVDHALEQTRQREQEAQNRTRRNSYHVSKT